jgi:hypothetical protein
MNARATLQELNDQGVNIEVEAGELVLDAPSGVLTDELVCRVREVKSEIRVLLGCETARPDVEPDDPGIYQTVESWPEEATHRFHSLIRTLIQDQDMTCCEAAREAFAECGGEFEKKVVMIAEQLDMSTILGEERDDEAAIPEGILPAGKYMFTVRSMNHRHSWWHVKFSILDPVTENQVGEIEAQFVDAPHGRCELKEFLVACGVQPPDAPENLVIDKNQLTGKSGWVHLGVRTGPDDRKFNFTRGFDPLKTERTKIHE